MANGRGVLGLGVEKGRVPFCLSFFPSLPKRAKTGRNRFRVRGNPVFYWF